MKPLIVVIGIVLLCAGRADAIDLTTAGALSGAAQGFSNALSQWYAFEAQRQLMEEQSRMTSRGSEQQARYDRLRQEALDLEHEQRVLMNDKEALDKERQRLLRENEAFNQQKAMLDQERAALASITDAQQQERARLTYEQRVRPYSTLVNEHSQRLAEYQKKVEAFNRWADQFQTRLISFQQRSAP